MKLPKNSTRYINYQRDNAYDRHARRRYGKAKRGEVDTIIEKYDKRYFTIVTMIIKELEKRNISIEDTEFDKKIDEIIEIMLTHRAFKTISNDDNVIFKIRNAVKRNINSKKNEEFTIGE